MKIGLVVDFDAAHHLPGYNGKCSQIHGHTYTVETIIDGPVGSDGFVMDFYKLKEKVSISLKNLDHRDLNEIIPNPTAEKIAEWIHHRLKKDLEGSNVSLVSIKLWEGKNKWVMIE
jgi:6-pyruvoyltetrahydropterin/6-carboxytetrahydropterin synthase